MVRKLCRSRAGRARRAAYASLIALAVALGAQASIAAGADLHAADTAKLHYVGVVGEEVYETGSASGTMPAASAPT